MKAGHLVGQRQLFTRAGKTPEVGLKLAIGMKYRWEAKFDQDKLSPSFLFHVSLPDDLPAFRGNTHTNKQT